MLSTEDNLNEMEDSCLVSLGSDMGFFMFRKSGFPSNVLSQEMETSTSSKLILLVSISLTLHYKAT